MILAAGSSTRLGSPKQLVSFKNSTLLEYSITQALLAGLSPVLVVTGSDHIVVNNLLKGKKITTVHNENWEQGMGSSISSGIVFLQQHFENCRQVIISVCDQPLLRHFHFTKLCIAATDSAKAIITSTYAGTAGVPVLFKHKYFPDLSALKGEEGAKKLIKSYNSDVAEVPFAGGNIDIDTPSDVEILKHLKQQYEYWDGGRPNI